MAYEQNPYAVKITAVADATGASVVVGGSTYLQTQFTFVKLATASITSYNESGNVVTACTVATDRPLGILQNQPKAWFDAAGNIEGVSEAEVTISGISKIVAGDSVTVGDALTIDASGRAVTAQFGVSAAAQTTATITGATASGTTVAYTTNSTTAFTVGQFVAVSGIVQTGTGAGSLNYEGVISAVSGSSGSYAFTITNPVASTVTYGSAGSVKTTTSSTQYILGTALASGIQGDVITMAVAAAAAGRAA